MPKKITYADWLKAEKTNINGYAGLMARNTKIANTPETARGGYSALATANSYDEDFNAGATYGIYGATPDRASTPTAPVSPYAVPEKQEEARNKLENALSSFADSVRPATSKALQTMKQASDRKRKEQWASVARFKQFASNAVKNAPNLPKYLQMMADERVAIAKGNRNTNADTFTDAVSPSYVGDSWAKAAEAVRAQELADAQAHKAQLEQDAKDKAARIEQGTKNGGDYGYTPSIKEQAQRKAAAGTNSTATNAELTGYAKFLADHPEYDEANRLAEAEYARSLPTYGALAEQMAQAGIHGGYSDYLNAQAYAQMQNAKQTNEEAARQGYKDYLTQQEAEAKANAEKAEAENKEKQARISGLYQVFTTGGTDADGNSFDGLGLQNILDETQFKQAVEQVKQRYKNLGYDDAEINDAVNRVKADRELTRTTYKNEISKTVNGLASNEDEAVSDFLQTFGYTPPAKNEGESDADYEKREEKAKSAYYLDALDSAVNQGMMEPKQRSAAIKAYLPIYKSEYKNYSESDWQSRASDLAETAISAKMLHDNKRILDADYNQIVADIKTKLKDMKVSVEEQHSVGWDNIRIDIGNHEIIHADQYASVDASKEKELDDKFGKSPLAVEYTGETDDEDNAKYKIYYREGANRRWEQISTKQGSASGGVENGNKMLAAIAIVMEEEYKDKAPYTEYDGDNNYTFDLFGTKSSEQNQQNESQTKKNPFKAKQDNKWGSKSGVQGTFGAQ